MSAICSEISSVALAVWLASDLTSGFKQCRRGLQVFLPERRLPRRLRDIHLVPEFLLLPGQDLEETVQLRHQHRLLGELDARQYFERAARRGHFSPAPAPQILVD